MHADTHMDPGSLDMEQERTELQGELKGATKGNIVRTLCTVRH